MIRNKRELELYLYEFGLTSQYRHARQLYSTGKGQCAVKRYSHLVEMGFIGDDGTPIEYHFLPEGL